jgi:hypothetical protein
VDAYEFFSTLFSQSLIAEGIQISMGAATLVPISMLSAFEVHYSFEHLARPKEIPKWRTDINEVG